MKGDAKLIYHLKKSTLYSMIISTYLKTSQKNFSAKKYNDAITEQLKLGIIKEAPEDYKVGESHCLPHHAIFQDKNTSKIGIAFDVPARSEGPNLNDCLYKGP